MKHILICPTWACQNHCRYCWMDYTVRARPEMMDAMQRPASDWIAAIKREPVMVDIAGGEPLLYHGICEIIEGCPETTFGLSTNGMHVEGINKLVAARLLNLISINLSIHADNGQAAYFDRFKAAFLLLRATGYNVFASVVKYEDELAQASPLLGWLRRNGATIVESPYEDMHPDKQPRTPPLVCDAGVNHLVMAPDGSAWPCLGAMWSTQWRETMLGNWLDDTVDVSRVPKPCKLYCESYVYLLSEHPSGDMWKTNVRVYQGAGK